MTSCPSYCEHDDPDHDRTDEVRVHDGPMVAVPAMVDCGIDTLLTVGVVRYDESDEAGRHQQGQDRIDVSGYEITPADAQHLIDSLASLITLAER